MPRNPNTNATGGPFDDQTIERVWEKGTPEPYYAGFRKDVCAASMRRGNYGKTERWGWEIDHRMPVSNGGGDDLDNLQPLQWENNRHKGDKWPWPDGDCKVTS